MDEFRNTAKYHSFEIKKFPPKADQPLAEKTPAGVRGGSGAVRITLAPVPSPPSPRPAATPLQAWRGDGGEGTGRGEGMEGK
jgi:hypothetical protein